MYIRLYSTVRCRYNAVNFLKNIHKYSPLGRGSGCLLNPASGWSSAWVPAIIYVIFYYIGPCYSDTRLYSYCILSGLWYVFSRIYWMLCHNSQTVWMDVKKCILYLFLNVTFWQHALDNRNMIYLLCNNCWRNIPLYISCDKIINHDRHNALECNYSSSTEIFHAIWRQMPFIFFALISIRIQKSKYIHDPYRKSSTFN